MSRPRWELRDAAVGYASRGIPVLPLHYPLPHRSGLQPVPGDPQPVVEKAGCSCRDPDCGQIGKHPLGSLVPHGVTDATCNRARVLAWWTCHPQANIGLATGQQFDVLDVDGPAGAHAIQELAATHGLHSSGPLVRTGGGGWHYYLARTGLGNASPAGLAQVDWRGRGGYVVAPPSRHASGHPYQWAPGRDLDTPLAEVPAPLRARLERRPPARPAGPVQLPATGVDRATAMRGRPWPRSSPGSPPPRSATATGSCGSRPATSTTWSPPAPSTPARSTTSSWPPLSAVGCWPRSPRQTHRTLASGRQVGLAHPGRPRQPPSPERTHASRIPPARAAGERTKEGR